MPVNASIGMILAAPTPAPFIVQCRFLTGGSNATSMTLTSTFGISSALAPGFNDVYQTNIPGLGIRYTFNAPQCTNVNNITLANNSLAIQCPFNGPIGGPYIQYSVTVSPTLIVTGTIASGASQLSSVPSISVSYAESDIAGNFGQTPIYTGVATGTLTHATCTVNTSNVTVQLPTVSTSSFSAGVGAASGQSSFSLSLACSTGAVVYVTFTDNINPANLTDTLQLAPSSTAQGVGVQIVDQTGSPILLGPDSAAPGNTHQRQIGNSPNGILTVPLAARYIRTGTVTPGTVLAQATFTMSYQQWANRLIWSEKALLCKSRQSLLESRF